SSQIPGAREQVDRRRPGAMGAGKRRGGGAGGPRRRGPAPLHRWRDLRRHVRRPSAGAGRTAGAGRGAPMSVRTLAQALNHALDTALAAIDEVLVLGEDVGHAGGVFRITDGLRDRYGPQRVIDTPLAESAIVGVGLGLAIAGFRPVLELQFMGFSYP